MRDVGNHERFGKVGDDGAHLGDEWRPGGAIEGRRQLGVTARHDVDWIAHAFQMS